eukprot:10640-Heterococcus_DN1.PRE.1
MKRAIYTVCANGLMLTTCTRHHITFSFVAKASMRRPARRCSRHHSDANSIHSIGHRIQLCTVLNIVYASLLPRFCCMLVLQGHTATSAANQQGHVNVNNYAESMYTQSVLTIKGYAQAHAAPVPVVT